MAFAACPSDSFPAHCRALTGTELPLCSRGCSHRKSRYRSALQRHLAPWRTWAPHAILRWCCILPDALICRWHKLVSTKHLGSSSPGYTILLLIRSPAISRTKDVWSLLDFYLFIDFYIYRFLYYTTKMFVLFSSPAQLTKLIQLPSFSPLSAFTVS